MTGRMRGGRLALTLLVAVATACTGESAEPDASPQSAETGPTAAAAAAPVSATPPVSTSASSSPRTAPSVNPPEPTELPATVTPGDAEPEDVYATGWPAVHGDAGNSDRSSAAVAADLDVAWQRSFDGPIEVRGLEWTVNLGPTSDDDGHLYFTSSVPDCHLQQLDLSTGTTNWCAPQVGQAAMGSSPLLDAAGHVFLADDRAMRAFDTNGSLLWEHPVDGTPFSAQFLPSGNLVFVTHLGVVSVLDRATGREVVPPTSLAPELAAEATSIWACARGTEACPSANTIAIDAAGDVYLTWWEPGAVQGGVLALAIDEEEGTVERRWEQRALAGGSGSSPTLSADGTRLYVTDNVDTLLAIDTASGATVWRHRIGVASGGSISVSVDGVLVPTGGPLTGIRDAGDHSEVVWRHDDLVNLGIATQSANGRVVATVATAAGTLAAVVVDVHDGEVLDEIPLPGSGRFSVGITIAHDGTVVIPMIVGDVIALRPATGASG